MGQKRSVEVTRCCEAARLEFRATQVSSDGGIVVMREIDHGKDLLCLLNNSINGPGCCGINPPTIERSGDLGRRWQNKALDQPEESGDLATKRQVAWGMSVGRTISQTPGR